MAALVERNGAHSNRDRHRMFYNPKRRHGNNNRLSPVEFERRYFNTLASV
jgi:putative transposase